MCFVFQSLKTYYLVGILLKYKLRTLPTLRKKPSIMFFLFREKRIVRSSVNTSLMKGDICISSFLGIFICKVLSFIDKMYLVSNSGL